MKRGTANEEENDFCNCGDYTGIDALRLWQQDIIQMRCMHEAGKSGTQADHSVRSGCRSLQILLG